MKLHLEVLEAKQQRVLKQTAPLLTAEGFYLAGGTALALQLGHRRSVDLDWFTASSGTDISIISGRLLSAGVPLEIQSTGRGTVHGVVHGVRLSLLEYPYPMLSPLIESNMGRMASTADIACMKLSALIQRGAKRDFVDVHALASGPVPLATLLGLYQRKYRIKDVGQALAALTYFDDAERQAMPRMLSNVGWAQIKRQFLKWVREVAAH